MPAFKRIECKCETKHHRYNINGKLSNRFWVKNKLT